MINPQWLELPMSRTNFHGPKDVRAIEIRLYECQHKRYKQTIKPPSHQTKFPLIPQKKKKKKKKYKKFERTL